MTEVGAKLDQAIEAFDSTTPSVRTRAAWLARRGVVVDPTLALSELLAPPADLGALEPGLAKLPPPLAAIWADPGRAARPAQRRRFAKRLQLLGALHRAGVAIVAGSDQALPGHSLHRELELYVEAGFTPLEAIRAATLAPARAMHRATDLGTIEVGKLADFIIVRGDPLDDIRALRDVRVVVTDGVADDPARLWPLAGFSP